MTTQAPIRIFECGCCGSYHQVGLPESESLADYLMNADCRNNEGRFASPEDAAERLDNQHVIEVVFDEDGNPESESVLIEPTGVNLS